MLVRLAGRALAACALVSFVAVGASSCGARTPLPHPGYWDVCSFRERVEAAPIELNLLLDASHSMDLETSDGVPKWDAVRDALGSFLVDPASAGIAVSLTVFPQAGTDEQVFLCSESQPCTEPSSVCAPLRACFPSLETSCYTDADCALGGAAGDTCHPLGFCSAGSEPCAAADPTACGGQEACVPQGYCAGGAACEPSVYEPPDVPLGVLPGAADALLAALAAQSTGNGTPTLPALQAVVRGAVARAELEPTHAVLVLLATDGFPTNCDPAIYAGDVEGAITSVADVAADGAKSGARTFVVGVVAPAEEALARPNLDRIASAGGTDEALMVTTNQSATEAFSAALEEVRYLGARCQHPVPPAEAGAPERDLDRVRVRLVLPNRTTELPLRDGSASCDAGGGFYVVTNETGAAKIVLCPSSCNAATGADVEVEYPCSYEPPGSG